MYYVVYLYMRFERLDYILCASETEALEQVNKFREDHIPCLIIEGGKVI